MTDEMNGDDPSVNGESTSPQLELPIRPEPLLPEPIGVGTLSFFALFRGTLFEPKATFQRLTGPLSVPFALFFALGVHWAGSALEFIWRSSLGHLVEDRTNFWLTALQRLFLESADPNRFPFDGLKQQVAQWIWGIGAVLIDPLKTLQQVLTIAIFVWFGGKLLHRIRRDDGRFEANLSFEMALTLVCLAQGPTILQGVPVYGMIVSPLFSFLVLTLGAQVIYRVSFFRGMVIAAFPTLVYFGSLLFGIFVLVRFIANLASQIFFTM